jgi:hypothetical protein
MQLKMIPELIICWRKESFIKYEKLFSKHHLVHKNLVTSAYPLILFNTALKYFNSKNTLKIFHFDHTHQLSFNLFYVKASIEQKRHSILSKLVIMELYCFPSNDS